MVLRRPPESRLDRTLARRSGEKARGNPGLAHLGHDPRAPAGQTADTWRKLDRQPCALSGAQAGDAVEGIAWVQEEALLTPIQADCILLWGSPGLGPGFPDWPSSSSAPGSGPVSGDHSVP